MLLNRRCKITFIAHGATIYSDEYRLTHSENYPPLNEAGEEEMGRVCEFLKKRSVKNDKIYSSAGTRAVESAEIIAKLYKKEVEVIDTLSPRLYGNWNNLTLDQIYKKHSEAFSKMLADPNFDNGENSESLTAFATRVGETIEKIISQNLQNRIIIVTYPEVIQAGIVTALNLPPEKMFNFFIKTGSATQISYFEKFNSLKYCGYLPMD